MSNPFALFDLPVAFEIDLNQVSARYLELQKTLHPDNFVASSAQEQRIAMQKSAEINDALQTLKDPIRRAEAIIQFKTGEAQNLEEKSTRDMDFLMQQLEWRERLEQLEHRNDLDELTVFLKKINGEEKAMISQLSTALSAEDWQKANAINDKLRYIKKLIAEIERVEEKLVDF